MSLQTASTAAFNELQEERDNYLAQVMSAEEAIGAKNSQLENVRRELDKVRREFGETKIQLDTIPVLEAQVIKSESSLLLCPRCFVSLGVIPGYLAVNGFMASVWHS